MFRLFFFFFNDTATTEIYTLSLHDALPIFLIVKCKHFGMQFKYFVRLSISETFWFNKIVFWLDRKSTRLNSSHVEISYAVFCLKKKNITVIQCNLQAYNLAYLISRRATVTS